MSTVSQALSGAVKTAGQLVGTFVEANPAYSESEVQALVTRNADVLVNKVVTSPLIQPIADSIVNEIIGAEVPALYAEALAKLGAPAVNPTPAQ